MTVTKIQSLADILAQCAMTALEREVLELLTLRCEAYLKHVFIDDRGRGKTRGRFIAPFISVDDLYWEMQAGGPEWWTTKPELAPRRDVLPDDVQTAVNRLLESHKICAVTGKIKTWPYLNPADFRDAKNGDVYLNHPFLELQLKITRLQEAFTEKNIQAFTDVETVMYEPGKNMRDVKFN
jgi:hypothetical protein